MTTMECIIAFAAFSLMIALLLSVVRKKSLWQPLSWRWRWGCWGEGLAAPLHRIWRPTLSLLQRVGAHVVRLLAALPPLIWPPFLWQHGGKGEARLPPAPPGRLPFLGHLHLLGKLPHQAVADLARQHGPSLMFLWLGSVPTIVASTPEAAKLLLQTHDQVFASRPRSAASVHMGFNNSSIVMSPPTESWRRMRQLCTMDLLSPKRVLAFRWLRQKGVHELLRAMFEQRGQEVRVRSRLLEWSLDSMSKMIMGKRVCEMCPEAPELIQKMLHLTGVFNVGDFIPCLAPFDLQGYEKGMRQAGQRWNSVLQKLVELRRSGESHQSMDLLEVLLSKPNLTDDNIKGIVSDLLIAGSETTSITIEWALAELIANPTTMMTLQEELHNMVGNIRLVEEEDIPSLPFLNAVVKETMRLHPVAPFLIPRESLSACQVHGYSIPPKTRVLVNWWSIGRSPHAWDCPELFEPNRFLPGGKCNHLSVHGQQFQYLPFGFGRRQCPGITLGLANVHLMLASLVQAFDWNLPCDVKQVDLSEEFGLTLSMACPLYVIPSVKFDLSTLYQDQNL